MSDQFVEAFVRKLILLEQRTGANVQYRVMPPFPVPFQDHLSIQKTARDIALFVGLTGFNFIVDVRKLDRNVGGHIHLSNQGRDVRIEIDENMMEYPDAVAATLCHEVCHKWLHFHGIASAIEMDNEILTDITSVFLGFGKIMLNGCETSHTRYEITPNGTGTITGTMTAGYLNRDQLAFAYRLVCAMRKISEADFLQGLNPDATQAVLACDFSYGHHYDRRFHEPETMQRSVADFLVVVTDLQFLLADLDKHMVFTKKSFIETTEAFHKSSHRSVESLRAKAIAMTERPDADPVMRFLHSVQYQQEFERMRKELGSVKTETSDFLAHARVVGRILSNSGDRFPTPSAGTFAIVVCPKDGTRLRLPEDSGNLIATCPSCKYRFAYNTKEVSFADPIRTPGTRQTLVERITGLFRRRKPGY